MQSTTFETGKFYISMHSASWIIKITKRTPKTVCLETYIDGVCQTSFGSRADRRYKIHTINGREYIDGGIQEYYPNEVPEAASPVQRPEYWRMVA